MTVVDFFFDFFFDEFDFFDFSEKSHWPKCFGKMLGFPWMTVVDFCFRPFFDDFEFLGRPGVSGRASWGLLGGPGGILGGSWAVLERLFEQSDFGSIF